MKVSSSLKQLIFVVHIHTHTHTKRHTHPLILLASRMRAHTQGNNKQTILSTLILFEQSQEAVA